MRRAAARSLERGGRDVSVVYGTRDRAGDRLRASLSSVRCQDYSEGRIQPVIVDYGSGERVARELEEIARIFDAVVLRVPNTMEWNRSHCLNTALRRCRSTFVLCLDADMVLPRHYVSTAVAMLVKDSLQVVYSRTWDLDAESTNRLGEKCDCLDEADWKDALKGGTLRFNGGWGLGLPLTFTSFVQRIRGFDERYRLWGCEDEDLAQRFEWLGLTLASAPNLEMLHQHHARHAGVSIHPDLDLVIEENRRRLTEENTILRNSDDWGRPRSPLATAPS